MEGMLRSFLKLQRQGATWIYKCIYKSKKLSSSEQKPFADRCLYKTKYGDRFYLNSYGCIDNNIKKFSVWEPASTNIVHSIVKQGDVVLDIGANIGYFTVIMSKIVGEAGKVLAFEPTKHFGEVLQKTIEVNALKNVRLYNYGLSDKSSETKISIGDSSATIHWLDNQGGGGVRGVESITLKKLDDIANSLNIEKLDFIKIDVDGHEPAFLEGAWNTIDKYKPIILMEIDHLHYLKAGVTAWDFYNKLREKGYHIYSEKNMKEYIDLDTFLYDCGNFNQGKNIIIKYT